MSTSLLWVDDQIGKFEPWVKKFTDHGWSVTAVSSFKEALDALKNKYFDAIFLDLMMGHQPSVDMLGSVCSQAQESNVFLCSGFLYREELVSQYRESIEQDGYQIGEIDKTSLPFTDDDQAIREFLEQVLVKDQSPHAATDRASFVTPADESDREHALEKLTLNEYMELDSSVKLQIVEEISEATRSVQSTYFDQGYRYLLFCGDFSQPDVFVKNLKDIPTEAKVLAIAKAKDAVPVSFTRGGRVDDVSSNCREDNGLRSYPTLTAINKGETEEIHFDSGNSYSLLSYEWYAEKGWVAHLSFLIDVLLIGEMELFGRHVEIENVDFRDASGQGPTADLKCFAVVKWTKCRLAARCGNGCNNQNFSERRSRYCKFRTGLLGRNLAEDLDVRFEIDFSNGDIFFR